MTESLIVKNIVICCGNESILSKLEELNINYIVSAIKLKLVKGLTIDGVKIPFNIHRLCFKNWDTYDKYLTLIEDLNNTKRLDKIYSISRWFICPEENIITNKLILEEWIEEYQDYLIKY